MIVFTLARGSRTSLDLSGDAVVTDVGVAVAAARGVTLGPGVLVLLSVVDSVILCNVLSLVEVNQAI